MSPTPRTWAAMTAGVVAVVAIVVMAVTAGGDSAVEIAGDTEPTTTAALTPRTDPAGTAVSSGIDWEALLGADDESELPGPHGTSPRPPRIGSNTPTSTTQPTDSAGQTTSPPTTPTGAPGAMTTTTVASAGPTATTVAPVPGATTTTTVIGTVTTSTTSPVGVGGSTTTSTIPHTSTTTTSTTTSTSTTATPTTTTTSTTEAPPTTDPPLAPFTRRIDSTGGSITVSWNGSALSLDSVDPERRHRPLVHEASATTIRVAFVARHEDSYISARVVDNQFVVNVG